MQEQELNIKNLYTDDIHGSEIYLCVEHQFLLGLGLDFPMVVRLCCWRFRLLSSSWFLLLSSKYTRKHDRRFRA